MVNEYKIFRSSDAPEDKRSVLVPLAHWAQAFARQFSLAVCVVAIGPPLAVVMVGPALTLGLLLGLASCYAIMMSPAARLAFTIVGAIVTFQSTSNQLKLGYLVLVAVCLAFAARELLLDVNSEAMRPWRPFLIASAATFIFLVLTGPLALTRGVLPLDWARDVSPLLFATALPVVGLEAGLRVRNTVIMRLFVIVGIVSTASFVLQWLTNRDVAGVGRLTYGDNYLTASLFCLCIAAAAGGSRKLLGQVSGAIMFGSVLLTGNRSLLTLMLGFVGVVGSTARGRMSLGTLTRALVLLGVSLAVILQLAIMFIPGERALLAQRVAVTQVYLETGEDQSARSRARQRSLALAAFNEHPVFGTGPGHLYTDPYFLPGVSDPRRNRGTFFTLDTPLVIPAKFGVVGTGVLIVWLSFMAVCIGRWIRDRPPTVVGNALRAFAVIGLALLPFGVTPEQKGFSITIMLFIAALVSDDRIENSGEVGRRKHRPSTASVTARQRPSRATV